MSKHLFTVAAILLATPTLAANVAVVPEIDAMSGLAAIAAIGAVGALVWERRKR